MAFNKNRDDIAITIPKFRMRKGADIGKNEIGIVSIAVDSSGISNPTPSIFTNYFFIPKVKKWTWVEFGGHGRIIYGPKNPGSFVYYNVLFVESDQDVREFGETLLTVFESKEANDIIKLLATPNPTALLVSTVVFELGKLVGKLLQKNKNDLIYSTEGSFFQATNPPYNVGDTFSNVGVHIECAIKVLPLPTQQGDTDNKFAEFSLEAMEGATTNNLLSLEKMAGVPQTLTIR